MALDELEVCIQLVQLENQQLKKATYQEIKEIIEKEFSTNVAIEDVYLLHEPNIEQIQEDMEIHYGAMFNVTRDGQYY